jgi:hypothetical protein
MSVVPCTKCAESTPQSRSTSDGERLFWAETASTGLGLNARYPPRFRRSFNNRSPPKPEVQTDPLPTFSENAGGTLGRLTLTSGKTTHASEFVGDYAQTDFTVTPGATTTIKFG